MNEANTITNAKIKDGLPLELQPYIIISQSSLPLIFEPIVKALWDAAKIINPIIFTPRSIDIIFGVNQFNINMSSGVMSYIPKNEVINVFFKDMIFINCDKMLLHPYPIQVVCILEEFVHAFLNIKDEQITSQVVALLYNGVILRDGKYCPI